MAYGGHYEARTVLDAPAQAVFAFLDDPLRLVAHMSRPTLRMGHASMRIELDATGGRAPGSVMRLRGRFLAWPLAVDEEVIDRREPLCKTWQTFGAPALILLAGYRMGFGLEPREDRTQVTIWIDYALPAKGMPALLGRWFGSAYARWCVDRMIHDTIAHFSQTARA